MQRVQAAEYARRDAAATKMQAALRGRSSRRELPEVQGRMRHAHVRASRGMYGRCYIMRGGAACVAGVALCVAVLHVWPWRGETGR